MYLKTLLNGNKIVTNVIESGKLNLEQMQDEIGCRTIDIVNLNDNIAIICDDEGLLVANNPVYSIIDDNGNERQIAGTFLIAKDVMTEDGPDARGFDNLKEARELMGTTKISVIGVTAI